MERKKEDAERRTVTRDMFRKNVAEVGQLARRDGGVIVTDAQGRARFLVSTPADKWPVEATKKL